MKSKLPFLAPLIFVILCSGAPIQNINRETEMLGIWVYTNNGDERCNCNKFEKFRKNRPGFEFKKNGEIIRRRNDGDCGTPPISYGNFVGQWKFISDSLIIIKYKIYTDEIEEDWEVLELTAKKLVLTQLGKRINGTVIW